MPGVQHNQPELVLRSSTLNILVPGNSKITLSLVFDSGTKITWGRRLNSRWDNEEAQEKEIGDGDGEKKKE